MIDENVNIDGIVSMVDLVRLNQALAKIVELNKEQEANADCCYDGTINASDARALLQYLVIDIDELPLIPESK